MSECPKSESEFVLSCVAFNVSSLLVYCCRSKH